MREFGESKFVAGLREFASGLNSVVQATTGWAPIVAAMAAYKVAQFTGIIAGLKGVAGAMRLLGAVSAPAWLMPLLAAMAAAKGAQEFAKDPGSRYRPYRLQFDGQPRQRTLWNVVWWRLGIQGQPGG